MAKPNLKDKGLSEEVIVTIICLVFTFFYYRIFYKEVPFLVSVPNVLFGADVDERIFIFFIRARHFLHYIIWFLLTKLFYLFLDPYYSAKLISAIMGVSASLVIFLISRKLTEDFFISILLFLCYGCSATVITFSSIPESFMTTAFAGNVLVLFYLYADVTKTKDCIFLAAIIAACFFASGHYLVIIIPVSVYIFLINHANKKNSFKNTVIFAVSCVVLIIFPVLLCTLIFPNDYYNFLWHLWHEMRWFSFKHLLDYNAWRHTLANFFFFSISPPDVPFTGKGVIPISGFTAYFTKFPGFFFIATYVAILYLSFKKIFGHWGKLSSKLYPIFALGVISMLSFVAFDPFNSFTFSSFFLIIPFFVIACGISFVTRRRAYFLLSAFLFFILLNNTAFLSNAVNHIAYKKISAP